MGTPLNWDDVKPTMSIIGGIDMYSRGERFKSDSPPAGRKIRFLGQNGRDSQLQEALDIMPVGQILTVKEIYVGGSCSYVEVEEHEGRFNTVMFADMEASHE